MYSNSGGVTLLQTFFNSWMHTQRKAARRGASKSTTGKAKKDKIITVCQVIIKK